MLMFIFGAGASYDSDPQRKPPAFGSPDQYASTRPPLAAGLFSPKGADTAKLFSKYSAANPLVMRLREAVGAGRDLEQVLEGFEAESYSGRRRQLLALRALLSELLTVTPNRWFEECQGQTNYVLALEAAAQWRERNIQISDDPFIAVSFNYDTLLESACGDVLRHFGFWSDIESYLTAPEMRLYKPHGSVSWTQFASTPTGFTPVASGPDGPLFQAIERASELEMKNVFEVRQLADRPEVDEGVWVPGLMLPLHRKSVFTFPDGHLASLKADLTKVDFVVAVGWRANEEHFLELMKEHIPHGSASLVAVGESDEAAMRTADNLYRTGCFGRQALATKGFSSFTSMFEEPSNSQVHAGTLTDILDGTARFTIRRPPRPNEIPQFRD